MLQNIEFGFDQAAGLRHLTNTSGPRMIAVSAGKGGVGKSNISVNLSLALAKKQRKVLLLDADFSLANIDVLLGLHSRYNLSHVLQGLCRFEDILLTGPSDIRIVPAASGLEHMAQLTQHESANIIHVFKELGAGFDYLIIDTAAGISEAVLRCTDAAQEMIVIACDEPTSITDAYALIKVMHKRYHRKQFRILANMVRSMPAGTQLFNKLHRVAEQFLDVDLTYLGAIPFDEGVHEAVKKQKAVLELFPESQAAQAFQQVAEQIELWPFSRTF